MLPLSYLFVPGNRPERFAKALASGADALVLDLEDAVAPADKAAARQAIAQWAVRAALPAAQLVVRINDAQSPWFADDLAMLKAADIQRVMLAKAESAEQVRAVSAALAADARVLPLVESARGVSQIAQIAQAGQVERIAFGTLDYAVDLDLSGDERGLIHPYSQIAIASRVAGLAGPIAGVTASLGDSQRLEADFAFARALGCTAKLCIHPQQVSLIHQFAQPSAEQVAWAEKVLAAIAGAAGAVQVDGKMVDRPVALKAEAILARHHAAARRRGE